MHLRNLILLSTLCLLLSGCQESVEPIFESPTFGFKIFSDEEVSEEFLANIESYTAELIALLDSDADALKTLEIRVVPANPTFLGYFSPPDDIVVTPQNALQVYGHELVRFDQYREGGAWDQSSDSWTGKIGEDWTIAENLALQYLK